MKSKLLMSGLVVAVIGFPLTAMASDQDCFPICAEPAKAQIKSLPPAEITTDTITVAAPRETDDTRLPTRCNNSFMKKADELEARSKSLREIVGHIRSPQGLAIKLVNDHVVKLPAWVGYAMDPVGSIKHRVIDQVKTRAKDAMRNGESCPITPAPAPETVYPEIDIYGGVSA